MIITGSTIYNHFSHPCLFRIHLDLFGDKSERSKPSVTGRYLMERGNRHEARFFESIKAEFPDAENLKVEEIHLLVEKIT